MSLTHASPPQQQANPHISVSTTPQTAQAGPSILGWNRGPGQGQNTVTQTQIQADPKVVEARRKITEFCSQTYSRKNWVTADGYGAFDLVYEPVTSIAFVTVNLEFDFQNAPPSVLMKYLGRLDIKHIAECSWNEQKKKKFQDDMITQVDRVWSNQQPIKCIHNDPDLTDGQQPTWSDLHADMNFVVKPVTSGGHFKVTVIALPMADSLRSHVSPADHDATNTVTPNRSQMRATQSGMVGDANFVTTSATLNSHDNETQKIPSSFSGKTYTVKQGDTLESIAEDLLGDRNRWPEIYQPNKSVIGPDPQKIIAGQVLTLQIPDTEQVTSAHEFGHMLGLDDQYINGGGGSAQPGAITDDGTNTTSATPAEEHQIMDGGEVVKPGHYATVVEALNDATNPIVFAV